MCSQPERLAKRHAHPGVCMLKLRNRGFKISDLTPPTKTPPWVKTTKKLLNSSCEISVLYCSRTDVSPRGILVLAAHRCLTPGMNVGTLLAIPEQFLNIFNAGTPGVSRFQDMLSQALAMGESPDVRSSLGEGLSEGQG